jgi:hypothetical protein
LAWRCQAAREQTIVDCIDLPGGTDPGIQFLNYSPTDLLTKLLGKLINNRGRHLVAETHHQGQGQKQLTGKGGKHQPRKTNPFRPKPLYPLRERIWR